MGSRASSPGSERSVTPDEIRKHCSAEARGDNGECWRRRGRQTTYTSWPKVCGQIYDEQMTGVYLVVVRNKLEVI